MDIFVKKTKEIILLKDILKQTIKEFEILTNFTQNNLIAAFSVACFNKEMKEYENIIIGKYCESQINNYHIWNSNIKTGEFKDSSEIYNITMFEQQSALCSGKYVKDDNKTLTLQNLYYDLF